MDLDDALAWVGERKHAVLITTKSDGSPQSSDVVYAVWDDTVVVSVTDGRAKTANMRRDPRIVVHITEPSSWSYVSLSGEAQLGEIAQEPGDEASNDLLAYFEDVSGEEHSDPDEYRQAMVDDKRLLVRFKPDRAVGQLN